MNKKDLFDVIGGIDEDLIEKSETIKNKTKIYKIIIPVAAALCIVITSVILFRNNFIINKINSSSNGKNVITDNAVADNNTDESIAASPDVNETVTEISEETIKDDIYEKSTDSDEPEFEPDYDPEINDGLDIQYTSQTTIKFKSDNNETETVKSETTSKADIKESTTAQEILSENSALFNGVVTQVSGNTIVVEKYEHKKGEAISSSSPIYPTDELYEMTNNGGNFNVGDKVTVYYTGNIAETNPMQINAYKIDKANFPTE